MYVFGLNIDTYKILRYWKKPCDEKKNEGRFSRCVVLSEEVASKTCVTCGQMLHLPFSVNYAFNLADVEQSVFGFISHITSRYSCLASFRLEVICI